MLLEFPTRKELNLAMFRISEYYEGDDTLRGRHWTPDLFLDRWTDKTGEMRKFGKGDSYFAFWDGYNIPMEILRKFEDAFTLELSLREISIMVACSDVPTSGYLIACVKGDKLTRRHEEAHGHFYESKEYRKKALAILDTLAPATISKIERHLREVNYTTEVLTDEMHAYMVAYEPGEWRESFRSVRKAEIAKQVKALGELFDSTS